MTDGQLFDTTPKTRRQRARPGQYLPVLAPPNCPREICRTPDTARPPLPGDGVKLPTAGLLSKWGFQDGDILEDLLWDNGYGETWRHDCSGCDSHGFDHRVLIRVVREHVIPQIEQAVDVFDIVTIHNPIRANTVSGQPIDHYSEGGPHITPDLVEVPDNVILAIAAEEAAAPHRHRTTPRGITAQELH